MLWLDSERARLIYPDEIHLSSSKYMKIVLVTPAPPRSLNGNRVTASRWARILRNLGHNVRVQVEYGGGDCDLLIGLHGRRSNTSMELFKRIHPELPMVLVLTGTDLYEDTPSHPEVRRSLELADAVVVLQPRANDDLPEHIRPKVQVIIQSARPTPGTPQRSSKFFDIVVAGHLREVKDPFRAAIASRLLRADSRVRIVHAGEAMSMEMEQMATEEMRSNFRYKWVGGVPRWRSRRLIRNSNALVVSSLLEGGANVISEALSDHVPIIASKMPGNIGLLGKDYPGYFQVGNSQSLANLIAEIEANSEFLRELRQAVSSLEPGTRPEVEHATWAKLLRKISVPT